MEKYQSALDNVRTLRASFGQAAAKANVFFGKKPEQAALYAEMIEKIDSVGAALKSDDKASAFATLDTMEQKLEKQQQVHIDAYHAAMLGITEKKNIQQVSHYRTEILRIRGKINEPS